MGNRNLAMLTIAALTAVLLYLSTFSVSETEYAIKFRFKEIVGSDYGPGLHFQLPLVENVRKFDKRLLTADTPEEKFLTSEGKILLIDFFMKWQIEDINRFYQATSADEEVAARRLGDIVKDGLKGIIAKHTLQQVVQRTGFIEELRANSAASTAQLGIKLVDVRVKKINLPDEVGDSVYNRMKQDFAQQAAKLRAEGKEISASLESKADRERTEFLAEGYRQAEIIKGEGDARAAETYAKAYSRNPEFYSFFRSMQAYRDSLGKESDVLVIAPDSEFFKYLKQPSGR
jgi:modulator of FtsH protease HflC